MNRLTRYGILAVVAVALLLGATALLQQPVQAARQPPIECGPTRQWICVLPGCPDCYDVLFEGTVCEKERFEKATGRVCSPEGG